jgi:coenzyme F420-dependent glucose-6-phosphate dehydrogenase
LKFCCIAEEVGFDSVFVSDLFQPWRHIDGHAQSSLVWLGALAGRTSQITIGTSVLTLPDQAKPTGADALDQRTY